jgi:hypothetical protein
MKPAIEASLLFAATILAFIGLISIPAEVSLVIGALLLLVLLCVLWFAFYDRARNKRR